MSDFDAACVEARLTDESSQLLRMALVSSLEPVLSARGFRKPPAAKGRPHYLCVWYSSSSSRIVLHMDFLQRELDAMVYRGTGSRFAAEDDHLDWYDVPDSTGMTCAPRQLKIRPSDMKSSIEAVAAHLLHANKNVLLALPPEFERALDPVKRRSEQLTRKAQQGHV